MLRYSLNAGFGDLVDELEFAITEGAFGDEGYRLLRRIMKRVAEARALLYELNEPPKATPPRRNVPPIVTTTMVH